MTTTTTTTTASATTRTTLSGYQRAGGDKRGSNHNRHMRAAWLIETFGLDGVVKCVHGCGRLLTAETVEADRIIPGGSYRRDNIQPSCRACNAARSNDASWTLTIEKIVALHTHTTTTTTA